MKPIVRPVQRHGSGWIWECRARRSVFDCGWEYTESYGPRGHGYTPDQAHEDWKEQVRDAAAPSAAIQTEN